MLRAGQSGARCRRPLARPRRPPRSAGRTDAERRRVESLLRGQRPVTGRPRHDRRTVLAGVLWVVRLHASWRAMPGECGRWETASKRYRLWRATGLWRRILEARPEGASQVSS
jgi:transposase